MTEIRPNMKPVFIVFTFCYSVSYDRFLNHDNSGSDIVYIKPATALECQTACTQNPQCVAIQSNGGDDCWIKWKFPIEAHIDNICTPPHVCDGYFKVGAVSPLSNAFANKGWFIDENIRSTPDDDLTIPGPYNWATTINATCELNNCFAKQFRGFPGLYNGYRSSDLSYQAGNFFATRTAVSNHFTLLQFTEYSGSIQFLTPSYTMSACMTECFHNPLCQYAYFSRNDLKCALLNNIDRSKLIYDMASYRGDMQIVNKTWQYNTAYSALPNYNLITVGGISVNAISADACLRYCTTYNKPACTFNYNANTCIYYASIDLNDLKNTTNNAMTFLLNSATGAEIVPFFTRELSVSGSSSSSYTTTRLSLIIDGCINNLYCTHFTPDVVGNMYKGEGLYKGLVEATSTMGMYPLRLTIKVRSFSYTKQIPGFIIQPNVVPNGGVNPKSVSFTYDTCWTTLSCNYFSSDVSTSSGTQYSGISLVAASSNMLITKTTIASQFIEVSNVTFSVYSSVTPSISLSTCLSNCFASAACTYVFYVNSDLNCFFVTPAQTTTVYSLTNQYSKDISSFIKVVNYLNYVANVDTLPNNVTLNWQIQTELNCIAACDAQSYCYGTVYDVYNQKCSIVTSLALTGQSDQRYVWYKRLQVITTAIKPTTTTTATKTTKMAVVSTFKSASILPTTSTDVKSTSKSNAKSSSKGPAKSSSLEFIVFESSKSDFVKQSVILSTSQLPEPLADAPETSSITEIIQGNIYLIIGLFAGLLGLILLTLFLSKYFKSPKYKSKFDTKTHSTVRTEDKPISTRNATMRTF